MAIMKPKCIALFFIVVGWTMASGNNTRSGQPIMIDTDIMSDVDDVGALTVANVLHNCGLADLRGIVINTHSEYGSLAANVTVSLLTV